MSTPDDYMTLEEAARYAGYRGTSVIRAAAADGRLTVKRLSDRVQFTRREWVDAYLASLPERREGYPRGKPRRPASEESP